MSVVIVGHAVGFKSIDNNKCEELLENEYSTEQIMNEQDAHLNLLKRSSPYASLIPIIISENVKHKHTNSLLNARQCPALAQPIVSRTRTRTFCSLSAVEAKNPTSSPLSLDKTHVFSPSFSQSLAAFL